MFPAARIPMITVWRPYLPESIDGKPLATTVSDLWSDFPYDRLPENGWLSLFLRPEGVIVMLVFYNVSKPLFKAIQKGVDPKASWFIGSIAVHNFLLAVFSAVVTFNTWPIVYTHLQTDGLFQTYCDPEGSLWGPAGFGAWSFIFYISKYYEFIDTWILVLKGKQPSFLQIYHHTGIAFCMWVGVLSQSSWLMYVTCLNSIIHTLMYTYFFIKTINPKIEIKAAKNLTMAQIGQFFTGILISFPVLIMGEKCDTASSRFGLAFLHVYGYGLIALFAAFAKRKYKKP
jgi:hypothetical protein